MKSWFRRDYTQEKRSRSSASIKKGRLIPFRRNYTGPVRELLARMINDSRSLGASEVFVGYPEHDSFQFVVGGETYTGSLPLTVYESIGEMLALNKSVILDWREIEVEDLRLGISRGGSEPIYCFSWKTKKDSQPTIKEESGERAEVISQATPLVLLVDDDLRFTQILSRILEEQGFQTLSAATGNEGLEILADFTPQLVITDVHMPSLSGPEFILESRRRGYSMPYLVLTGDNDALTEAEMVLLGVSAFVRKSEDPRILLAWCRRLTNLRRVS
jgi:CheY-like chemotaxis protein